MLKPRALRTGDRIALVAPASPFARDAFDAGAAELRGLGFDPVFDQSVFARTRYTAGDPALRAAAFRRAWTDPSIAALMAVRGGYGSVQLLPLLDARLAKGEAAYDRATFMRVLASAEPAGPIVHRHLIALRPGDAAGVLVGGTLTQLTASLGTPYAFDPPAGHILFIDEIAERPYRIDRMLTQLRLAGLLSRASAVIFGEMPRCNEPSDDGPAIEDVVADLLADFNGPVLFGLPSGHTVGATLTLPFGVRARVATAPGPAV